MNKGITNNDFIPNDPESENEDELPQEKPTR